MRNSAHAERYGLQEPCSLRSRSYRYASVRKGDIVLMFLPAMAVRQREACGGKNKTDWATPRQTCGGSY